MALARNLASQPIEPRFLWGAYGVPMGCLWGAYASRACEGRARLIGAKPATDRHLPSPGTVREGKPGPSPTRTTPVGEPVWRGLPTPGRLTLDAWLKPAATPWR